LDRLKVGDRFAELLPFLRVLDRVVESPLSQTNHLRPDPDSALVERLDRHLVTLADFAQHVTARYAALLENQLARAARADAEFVFLSATAEAGHSSLAEKRGDAAVSRGGVGGGEDDEYVGFVGARDPELSARQHPFFPVPDGSRGQRKRIAARPGFPKGVGSHRPA